MKTFFNSMRVFSASLFLVSLILKGCATANLEVTPAIRSYEIASTPVSGVDDERSGTLKVLTLNLAHGRGDSFHQLLQRSTTTITNLDAVASLLKDSGAHVVALQEADGPSFWSGNFDHIDYLAKNGDFRQSVHGVHADGMGLSYGTALLAKLDLNDPKVITFDTALSPVPKGFVVSSISWPDDPDLAVDVVSVHLNFASKRIREKQAMELIATLRDRKRPLIVMGDFNSEWQNDSAVQHISEALELSAHSPEGAGLETFPAFGERLDWILVSRGISFVSYAVVPHTVSDHLGVVAELKLDRATPIEPDG